MIIIMISFDTIWLLFVQRGATANQREAAEQCWNNYSAEQQQQIYDSIRIKLQNDRFVHFVPEQAIRENARRVHMAQPTNYNGARSLPSEPLVRAIYNGTGGIYTRREAILFHMDIKGDFIL